MDSRENRYNRMDSRKKRCNRMDSREKKGRGALKTTLDYICYKQSYKIYKLHK